MSLNKISKIFMELKDKVIANNLTVKTLIVL